MILLTHSQIEQPLIQQIAEYREQGARGPRFEEWAATKIRTSYTEGTQLRINFLREISAEIRINKTASKLPKPHLID